MKTSSAKAKGRNLQKIAAAALLEIGKHYGLEKDDLKSTTMGETGVDVQFSPAARRVLGSWAVECKNREVLNVPATFRQHSEKYREAQPLLVHKRNREEVLVTMRFSEFITMLGDNIRLVREVASFERAA